MSLTYEPGRAALARARRGGPGAAPARRARARAAGARRALRGRLPGRAAPPRARPVRAAPARIDPGAGGPLLEAGGERAEAELVAAEVLELLRAGVPGEEIAVVYRSLARAGAAARARVRAVRDPAGGRARGAVRATRRSGGRCSALARCALLERPGERRGPAGLPARPRAARAARDRRRPRGRCAPRRACTTAAAGSRAAGLGRSRSSTRCGAAGDPPAELARHARRLLAAPHRGAAPRC